MYQDKDMMLFDLILIKLQPMGCHILYIVFILTNKTWSIFGHCLDTAETHDHDVAFQFILTLSNRNELWIMYEEHAISWDDRLNCKSVNMLILSVILL